MSSVRVCPVEGDCTYRLCPDVCVEEQIEYETRPLLLALGEETEE